MKIPLKWLRDYINLDMAPTQIAEILTSAGLEVEDVHSTAPGFERVIVARVVDVQKHPNADKLCVATVSNGSETFQVVCGAPNCKAGMKTAFAQVGAVLRDEKGESFKVKQAKLRGVESFGMLCAADELGIGEDGDGIIEFPEHLQEGADVAEMYTDTVFDIALTPNLNYCSSVVGIARELSAMIGKPFHLPKVNVRETLSSSIENDAEVILQDTQGCPRYACRVVKNVRVGPSPDWMENRLLAAGIRPINNIVDITNYVLLELGHPLHAFDYDKLEEHTIVVRQAKEGERFTTLDEKERQLQAGDVLICDHKRPIALAGIMGGQNSEVSDATTNVLIESAYFNPTAIRKTSKRLGIQTEASRRFERGADPNGVLLALDRAAMLMQELASGQVVAGKIDNQAMIFPEKVVHCRLSRINQILGTHLSLSEVEAIFQRLKFAYKWDGHDTFIVTVPTWRVDVNAEIDLIEDVARVYGYNNIAKTDPAYHASALQHTPLYVFEREVRTRLVAEGLQEFITCDLIGPTLSNIVKEHMMPQEAIIKVLNPTSIEQSILRTSLLPGLLQVVKYNIDHQVHDINGFEIGRIHFKEGEQYKEETVLGIVLSGKSAQSSWNQKPHDMDFFDMKGILENLFLELNIGDVSFRPSKFEAFHTGRQASLFVGEQELGSMGEVHPTIQRRLDVTQRIIFAEISLHALMQARKPIASMQSLPSYPSSERDWTMTLQKDVPIHNILSQIKKGASPLLEAVYLLDVYHSEKLGDSKNVTFRFIYRDKDKTISQEAVDAEHSRILKTDFSHQP